MIFTHMWQILILFLRASLSGAILQEFLFEKPPFASCHASTIAETSSGHLLCAYFAGSEEGAKDVGIWLSSKSGADWSAPRLIANDPEVACWNPVLFTHPVSGEVLLFYKVGPRPSAWAGVLKRSQDAGQHWDLGENLPAGVLGPVKNKPLLLNNGTLLCGSSIEAWRRWGCWIDRTDDGGKTWRKSAPINLEETLFGIIQPTLFWGKEGQLCLLARSYDTGRICSSISKDEGETWSHARPISLPNPNAAIDAVRLKDGRILLVYNHSFKERTPLNVALSTDGGATWISKLVLEAAPGEYSYPSVIQTLDEKVHVTYTWNRIKIKHVTIDLGDL